MSAHEWFTIDGGLYCGACGISSKDAPADCRGRSAVASTPAAAAQPEEQLRASFELQIAPTVSDEEKAKYVWSNDTVPRLKECGFDSRFWQRIESNVMPGRSADFELWLKTLNFVRKGCRGVGAIFVLAGARGTGKTTICGQLAIERAENESLHPRDRQPPYRKLVDLIARYKPLYADFGSTKTDDLSSARDWYCSAHALKFIDEIHDTEEMKLKERVLVDIVDRTYSAKRDVILITNQSAEDFQASANASILSRISEHGTIIPCEWRSWRAKAA